MIAELISKAVLTELRRQAKLHRKEERERLLNMTMRDVHDMWQRDLSAVLAPGLAQSDIRRESQPVGVRLRLPALPSGENVGQYEDEFGLRLIRFAREAAAPVLVNFSCRRSKRFEETLRQSAKVRACRLHFYRPVHGSFAIEVEPRATPAELDANFLGRPRRSGLSGHLAAGLYGSIETARNSEDFRDSCFAPGRWIIWDRAYR